MLLLDDGRVLSAGQEAPGPAAAPARPGERVKRTVATAMNEFRRMIETRWPGDVVWRCPMSNYTSLRVGGAADAAAFPKNTEELSRLVQLLRQKRIPWHVIGRGSNILVADQGFRGVIVILGSKFSGIELLAEEGGLMRIRVEAGCSLAKLLNWCVEHGAGGLEFLAGIPGSVGGALMMNAGAWGREIADFVVSVDCLDSEGRLLTPGRDDLRFSYRRLALPGNAVVTAGTFALRPESGARVERACKEAVARRKEKQPAGVASAGSFFKNPAGHAAGRLIQDAGLKGARVGGAQVSPVHANFIVNAGDATARDIFDLMRRVQGRVLELTGIELEPEVRLIGEFACSGT